LLRRLLRALGGLLGLGEHLGDVRAVPARLRDDHVPGLRVDAELPAVLGTRGEQLTGLVDGELVRGDVVGHRGPLAAVLLTLEVGAITADAQGDALTDVDAVDRAGVDVPETLDERTQALGVPLPAVEPGEPLDAVLLAGGD